MIVREFKVWGGKREENDSLYIWAKDADDAIEIARLTDQSICISQWTGNEKSYEEAIKLVKEVTGMSLDWGDAHYDALQIAIKALEQESCTVDAKPIVHAHWIYGYTFPDGQYRKCSVCKELIKVVANDGNFCGHCGAKMVNAN